MTHLRSCHATPSTSLLSSNDSTFQYEEDVSTGEKTLRYVSIEVLLNARSTLDFNDGGSRSALDWDVNDAHILVTHRLRSRQLVLSSDLALAKQIWEAIRHRSHRRLFVATNIFKETRPCLIEEGKRCNDFH